MYGEEDYHNSTFLEWLADGKTEVKNGGNDENENEGEEDSDMGEDYQTFNQNRLVHPATGNSRVKSSFYYGIKHWLKKHAHTHKILKQKNVAIFLSCPFTTIKYKKKVKLFLLSLPYRFITSHFI